MSAESHTAIRDLTPDELDLASGALKVTIGPVRLKFGEDGLIFSLAVDGVGSVNLDDQGLWGNLGKLGWSLP